MPMPIRRAQEVYLTQHEQEVFDMRAQGRTWRAIAAQFKTSAHVLNCWLRASDSPERWPAWKAIDELAAEARAADAREILDMAQSLAECGVSSPEITRLAVARSDLAKWDAGVMHRQRFNPAAAAGNVVINVGALHLTAVKQLAQTPPPVPAGLLADGVPEAEFEIVSADDPALVEMSRRADDAALLEHLLNGD